MTTTGAPPAASTSLAEEPPKRRTQAESGEVVPGDQHAVRALRSSALADVERRHAERDQVGHRPSAVRAASRYSSHETPGVGAGFGPGSTS